MHHSEADLSLHNFRDQSAVEWFIESDAKQLVSTVAPNSEHHTGANRQLLYSMVIKTFNFITLIKVDTLGQLLLQ